MNSGLSVQVTATAEEIKSAVNQLPAYEWWKDIIHNAIICRGAIRLASTTRG